MLSKQATLGDESSMDDFIWIFVWCFIWAHIVDIAQMMGFALVLLIFALMCLAQLGKLYDWIKQECDLERLLDTPQKREDLKMEGTTFDFQILSFLWCIE